MVVETDDTNAFEDENRRFTVQLHGQADDQSPDRTKTLTREELEQNLYASVKAYDEYVGQRVQQQFGDGEVHYGTIRCGRSDGSGGHFLTVRSRFIKRVYSFDVATPLLCLQVIFDDNDMAEVSADDLASGESGEFTVSCAPPLRPLHFTRDTFALLTVAGNGTRTWGLVHRMAGGRLLSVEYHCDLCPPNRTSCVHINDVASRFLYQWIPPRVECTLPESQPQPPTGHYYRSLARVHPLSVDPMRDGEPSRYASSPADCGVGDVFVRPELLRDVLVSSDRFRMVLAVLSDFHGTFRVVKGKVPTSTSHLCHSEC